MTTTTEQAYEAAVERFVRGEDDALAFVAALDMIDMKSRAARRLETVALAPEDGQ